jgi:hypothetical protein
MTAFFAAGAEPPNAVLPTKLLFFRTPLSGRSGKAGTIVPHSRSGRC